MVLDFAGLAAVLGVLVAMTATAWRVIRDRAPLSQLEKIDAIVKNSSDKDPSLSLLRTARNHLRVRVALRALVPGQRVLIGAGYMSVAVGCFFVILAILAFIVDTDRSNAPSYLQLALYGAGFFVAGILIAGLALRSRYKTIRKVLREHKVADSQEGLFPLE